jgi:hypothetical protein
MMAGHMTPDARAVAIGAYKHAIRLGHRYLGGEHFLLALASAGQPADPGPLPADELTRSPPSEAA